MFYNDKTELAKAKARLNKVEKSKAGYMKTAGVRRKLEREIRKLDNAILKP